MQNQLKSDKIRNFILAGKSTFTIQSIKTDSHLTFKVNKKDDIWFVKCLMNGEKYTFIGTIFQKNNTLFYKPSNKSVVTSEATSQKVIGWLIANIDNYSKLDSQMIFLHSGKCGRCGKELTNPVSIESGLGPQCSAR